MKSTCSIVFYSLYVYVFSYISTYQNIIIPRFCLPYFHVSSSALLLPSTTALSFFIHLVLMISIYAKLTSACWEFLQWGIVIISPDQFIWWWILLAIPLFGPRAIWEAMTWCTRHIDLRTYLSPVVDGDGGVLQHPNRGTALSWKYGALWWLKSLCPNDAIWRHRSGSTWARVMACCLTAPSHYLKQCWFIISKIQLHSSDGNFTRDTSVIND